MAKEVSRSRWSAYLKPTYPRNTCCESFDHKLLARTNFAVVTRHIVLYTTMSILLRSYRSILIQTYRVREKPSEQ